MKRILSLTAVIILVALLVCACGRAREGTSVGQAPSSLSEAESVEDDGKGVSFNVFCFNVSPGYEINYKTGEGHMLQAGAHQPGLWTLRKLRTVKKRLPRRIFSLILTSSTGRKCGIIWENGGK